MSADETTGDDPIDDETTDEVEADDAEVSGLAMGLPGPLGSLPGLPGADGALGRKAGKDQMEYLTVTMQDVKITGTQ